MTSNSALGLSSIYFNAPLGALTVPVIQVNGIDLFYTIEGSSKNEPLLLVAGFDGNNSDVLFL